MGNNSGVIGPNGETIIASTHHPDPTLLPQTNDEFCWEAKPKWLGWLTRRYKCGHRGPRRFEFRFYGVQFRRSEGLKFCPDCLIERARKEVIRCALCGLPIVPHAPIALYRADSEGVRPDATKIGNNVVGCLRWECCPSAGFFVGHWGEDGKSIDFG